MPANRPSFANHEGEFQVDIYQPVDNLFVPFPNGPYDLRNYECALVEAAIPRVMWDGEGIGLRYFYTGGAQERRASSLSTRVVFHLFQNMLTYLNDSKCRAGRQKETTRPVLLQRRLYCVGNQRLR